MVMRFVIGQTLEAAKEAEILAESRQYGGFLRLSLQVILFNMWHACVIQQLGMMHALRLCVMRTSIGPHAFGALLRQHKVFSTPAAGSPMSVHNDVAHNVHHKC